MTDELALLEDVFDYLMERDFNIGTNFKESFPNSYIDKNKIVLVDGKNNEVARITLRMR